MNSTPGRADAAATRKVWVAMPTDYDQYGIEGIFDSLEAAKASRPGAEWVEDGDGDWEDARLDLPIYREEVQSLESIRCATAAAAAERSWGPGEREQVRAEVRKPLPYEGNG